MFVTDNKFDIKFFSSSSVYIARLPQFDKRGSIERMRKSLLIGSKIVCLR